MHDIRHPRVMLAMLCAGPNVVVFVRSWALRKRTVAPESLPKHLCDGRIGVFSPGAATVLGCRGEVAVSISLPQGLLGEARLLAPL